MNPRISTYSKVRSDLEKMNDDALAKILPQSIIFKPGINSTSGSLDINGSKVFIKRVRITDLELLPHNYQSTKNLFQLPLYYQYGVGSAGFGVWRELDSHLKTTQWVLSGLSANFPILYHWRILPRTKRGESASSELAEIEKQIAYWGRSQSIRNRLKALHTSTSELVLFLENIPCSLNEWFIDQFIQGWTEKSLNRIEEIQSELLEAISFMNKQGMIHFDAHSRNILINDDAVFLTDFGLANSVQFNLSPEEIAFFRQHAQFDLGEVIAGLCIDIFAGFFGCKGWPGDEKAKTFAKIPSLPIAMSTILNRGLNVAIIMNKFFSSLQADSSKKTKFPASELAEILSSYRLL